MPQTLPGKMVITFIVLCNVLFGSQSVYASSNSEVDHSHNRILAFNISASDTPSFEANGSGYLYSPRIVLTAGHFQDTGPNMNYFAFQNNATLKDKTPFAKVIKTFYPEDYLKGVDANDFAVFVLDKPLAEIDKARLISPDQLQNILIQRNQVTVTGYGVYQDACEILGQTPPCRIDTQIVPTSKEPRSIQMTPISLDELTANFGSGLNGLSMVKDHLFVESDISTSPCPGDSGGATTVSLDGEEYYLGTTPTGFWMGYNCGATPPGGSRLTLGYTAPVYKFLNLIQSAEDYVASHPTIESAQKPELGQASVITKKTVAVNTIICVKGKVSKKITSSKPACPKGYVKK